jgi:hypothetical protein
MYNVDGTASDCINYVLFWRRDLEKKQEYSENRTEKENCGIINDVKRTWFTHGVFTHGAESQQSTCVITFRIITESTAKIQRSCR